MTEDHPGPREAIHGVPIDLEGLLRSVTLLLARDPNPSRELSAAVALLRRCRARLADSAAPPPEWTMAAERERFSALPGEIAAIAGEDAAALARAASPPPAAGALEACLRARLPDGDGGHVENLVTIEGGYSKETSLFDWVPAEGARRPLALRRDVALQHIGTTVRDEFAVLRGLFRAGLAVPEPILLVTDDPAIPRLFMITRRLDGRSIGGPLGAGGGHAINPVPALARFLAGLHAIDPSGLGVPGFGEKPFDRAALLADIGYWHDRYYDHREAPSPTMDAAFAWLADNASAGLQPGAIVHGDCGIYNMLFDGDRFVAMLDWELVHVGSPAWDLAYVKDAVEEFGDYGDFIEAYVAAGGRRPPPEALDYYNVFRMVRSVTMSTVGPALFNRGEPVSLDLLNVNAALYPALIAALAERIA